jgi:hypothetical protein
MSRRAGALALGAYAVLLFLTSPAWPDDWDGVGFLESVQRFDLARFQPHPPGYPVYVALLRVAELAARVPMRACVIVAVASGVVAVAFAWSAARSAVGERGAWAVATLVAATPLAWRVCSGVGSEAPALACGAACAWGVVSAGRTRWAGALVLGVGVGLGLGVRLSWAPLYLATLVLAPPGARVKAWGAAAASSVAWLGPLVAIVGASRLYALTAAHFAGHAQRWGGTVVTEPGGVRLQWLARDLLVDGLGAGWDVLGALIGLALLLAITLAFVAWHRAGWRGWGSAALVVAPYLVWIALGQNLRDQPRHVLPLVAILSAAIALPAALSRRTFAAVGVLAVLVATRTALDAHARRTIPPPGVQLVELARAQPSPDHLDVFGVSSVRFFETTELAPHAFPAGSLGDVQVRLSRVEALPSRVWVTSEVEGLQGSPWPLEHLATLCRPPRIDRRAPCLEVYSWKLPYLRP